MTMAPQTRSSRKAPTSESASPLAVAQAADESQNTDALSEASATRSPSPECSHHHQHPHIPDTPCTTSWTHHSPMPPALSNGEKACLGVDEAGRGPVLGPMVYAAAYVSVDRKEELAKIGFADSKVLKEEERDNLFMTLQSHSDWIGWAVHACSPQDISGCMLRRSKHNLNSLAHDTTIELIRATIARGINVTEVYIDTVGPPASYAAKLQTYFPALRITVAKKADALYPIVSAASIAAKVSRDASLKGWKWIENGVEDTFSRRFGSGYPSDPNTVKWLNEHIDPIFGYPRIMRFSWATCVKLLEDKAIAVAWPEDDEDEDAGADIRGYFAGQQASVPAAPVRDTLLTSFKHVKRV